MVQNYWKAVKGAYSKGKSVDEAVEIVDLKGYEDYAFFQISRPEVRKLEISRMYHLMSDDE